MTETRPILCACGEELAEAVRIRNHFVLVGSDGQEIYRARLRCPTCGVWRWWHAEHILMARLEQRL